MSVSASVRLTVIIPTHNPHPGRLQRTLAGLRAQTLPLAEWETLLIDNASQPALALDPLRASMPTNARIVVESQLGLTHARRCGFRAARGEFIVMVDDDNVLAPDYLVNVLALFTAQPTLGAVGGRSVPEFEQTPPPWWQTDFDGLIACRDLGPVPQIAHGTSTYPLCAPIGAGMALRRAAVQSWLDDNASTALSDRRGGELTSGGDNDIVMTLLRAGWHVGYFPVLSLLHLIPADRVERDYLARLNRGIAKSWMQVLHKHGVNPWSPIASWTVPLRQLKAWLTYRAWRGPAEFVRWQGACGHFEGLASLRAAARP